jgi:hypothetical protein
MHRSDHFRRCIERIKGCSLRTVVFFFRQERFQFTAERFPACVFVSAGDRVRKDGECDRAKACETSQVGFFVISGQSVFRFDGLECSDRRKNVSGFPGFTGTDDDRRLFIGDR